MQDIFIGRESELKALSLAFEEASAGLGKVVMVKAEAGSGKSALIRKFISYHEIEALTAVAECYSINRTNAYTPLQEIIISLNADAFSVNTSDKTKKKDFLLSIVKESGPDWLQMIPIIGTFLSVGVTTSMSVHKNLKKFNKKKTINSQEDLTESFDKSLRVLSAKSKKTLIVFIDDMQWADASSIDVVFGLIKRIRETPFPVLLIFSYRTDEVLSEKDHPLLKLILNAKSYSRNEGHISRTDKWLSEIDLFPLVKDEIYELFKLKFPHNNFPGDFVQKIIDITEGNPLFINGILDLLLERGDIKQDATGSFFLTLASLNSLPETVTVVIQERIRNLDAGLKRILECASVASNDFTVNMLIQILEIQEILLSEQIAELAQKYAVIKADKTVMVNEQVQELYNFSHVLFRKHIYETLEHGQRRMYHRKIARFIQLMYAGELEGNPAIRNQLALHLQISEGLINDINFELTAVALAGAGNREFIYEQINAELDLAKCAALLFAEADSLAHLKKAFAYIEMYGEPTPVILECQYIALGLQSEAERLYPGSYFTALQQVEVARKLKDVKKECGALLNAGNAFIETCYQELGGYIEDASLSKYPLIHKFYFSEKNIPYADISLNSNNYGDIYQMIRQKELSLYQEALIRAQSLNDHSAVSLVYEYIGGHYHGMKQYRRAYAYYIKAMRLSANKAQIFNKRIVRSLRMRLNLN